ncbi:tyrosine-type recombinase/integrase [Microbacterium sp. J1-1]|uniref:tyrosine-type recombinase/integrase n=1 Tax=Microbacterium sp. J1-1 TaxID=2992441 RepID=UPI002115B07E|nr:site-specific integrase [Microbacterium sp. J1-1]UUE19148.1 tyrosine-type recombinase/integrase [Microbacterium sp. J1-1]
MGIPEMTPGSWGWIRIKQASDGKFLGRVSFRTHEGRRGETTAQATTKVGVERKLKLRLPALIAASHSPATVSTVTFATLAAEWVTFEELKIPDHLKARGTHAEHLRILRRHLLPAFGDAYVTDITAPMVFHYYMRLAADHAPLARNVKALLTQILAHAVNLGYIAGQNPAASVRRLRRPRRTIFAPEGDELRTLREATLAYMNDDTRPGPAPSMLLLDSIDLILATGERISEVFGLRFGKDIHLEGEVPYCTVNGAIKEKGGPKRWEPFPKTEPGRRELPLPDYAVAIILRRTIENQTGSEFLFHTRTGAPSGPQDAHRALRQVRKHSGLPDTFVPHALRKTVATQVARTLGLDAAAMILGHSKSRVTEQSYAKRDVRAPDARGLLQSHMEHIIAADPSAGATRRATG